ncbi:hypothetical protein [Streptomyces sp. RerS4]|uniref:hypothetical protein n=1 Tax=Streptomyces sp. RerS4 TaxID=2942449 RepID=UPI00201BECC9|nr:hypothetical protein [Streptomyces sp. RerS4]UQW99879.1 hypothetical protein M4D82_04510 [Streptomyces sp. RerS4]
MNRPTRRHARRTVVSSLIAASFLSGGLAALSPAATAAAPTVVPAIGTCTVTPAADGLSITITGSGWKPNEALSLNDGESTFPLSVDADGNFMLKRFQKNTDFTVLPDSGGFKNCMVAKADKSQTQKDKEAIRKARQDGFNAGVKAGKAAAQENCDAAKPKPPKKHPGLTAQDEAVEKAFNDGFLAGATSAFNKFCRTGGNR